MAMAVMNHHHSSNGIEPNTGSLHDPFTNNEPRQQAPTHRFSSYLDAESFGSEVNSSPSQARRTLQAHLAETERRLQDTHKLGTTLLQQQSELTEKLREVEQRPDDTELPAELKQRLADLGREHDDVGKEIARAMLAPRSRVVSAEDKQVPESPAAFASQATGSPSKLSVPSRRQRNQTSGRAGDIQFAADISTSFLAQVRQLQAVLAERDDALKSATLENARLEHEAAGFAQRLRALDESEQRYKDENWNLETQKHELSTAVKESTDREKRLNTLLTTTVTEKAKTQSELDDVKVAHGKLADDHAAAKKAHDSELHSLRRTVDVGENDRADLLRQVEELTSQNRELALAVGSRSRQQAMPVEPDFDNDGDGISQEISTPEHSPPPSPTKATPRHGGLESETLKSSLTHAHRMIQNLKGNIHREKTEKIELKRMLQEARDELEQQRGGNGLGSGSKRQKTRSDVFKKPLQPALLGKSRQPRTDVEMQDEDWEDNAEASPSHSTSRPPGAFPLSRTVTDASDAGNDTESAFETADERQHTESEAFETGAESLDDDSNDELTETEDTIGRSGTVRAAQNANPLRQVGNRSSYLSTASTSAGEEDDLRTPSQEQSSRFRLKNGKASLSKNSRTTTEASPMALASSPMTAINDRSPPAAEQSLFAELGGFEDNSTYNTPGRSSIASVNSTPLDSTRRSTTRDFTPLPFSKVATADVATSTDDLPPLAEDKSLLSKAAAAVGLGGIATYALGEHNQQSSSTMQPQASPSLPLVEPSVREFEPATQQTPSKMLQPSPMRNAPTFITPPKTVWDEAQVGEIESAHREVTPTPAVQQHKLGFSNALSQDIEPDVSPVTRSESALPGHTLAFSSIVALDSEPAPINQVSYADSPTLAASDPAMHSTPQSSSKTSAEEADVVGGAGAGILTTTAAALGLYSLKNNDVPIAEDETREPYDSKAMPIVAGDRSLRDVSGNRQAIISSQRSDGLQISSKQDQGIQTMLTSEQIEEALRNKQVPITPVMAAAAPVTPRPTSQSRDRGHVGEAAPLLGSSTPSKRPASANSHRSASFATQHPPLPSDHKSAIAKASSSNRVASPVADPTNSSHVSNLMGPPIAPASAYRRSRTPTGQSIAGPSPSRDGTTPRASHRQRHAAGSQVSRRSSVSSFASEIDERFNIRADQPTGAGHSQFEAGPGTDPRMIQAITQTMIGEYLWKYTRKPGRTDMSSTRHRRYFWVHPYTKTLYWSDQDPQTAGRSELKAKSVAIQSVRVVSDDNPLPPGLHRKSLEVITPGRKIKFTAATGQRHETWFNALSYLLLRGEDPMASAGAMYTGAGDEITNEDVNEFNAGYPTRPTLTTSSSRASMSTYNSRTTRGTSQNRMSMRQGLPAGYAASTSQRSQHEVSTVTRSSATNQGHPETNHIGSQAEANRDRDRDSTVRGTSSSRFSRMMSSVTGRGRSDAGLGGRSGSPTNREREHQTGSIYNASIVSDTRRDSAEALRQDLLKQERESDRLENVRACCDGKHDVSTLAAGGKHTHHHHGASTSSRSRHQSLDRLSRSVSKRPVGTITGPSAGTQAQGVVQMS